MLTARQLIAKLLELDNLDAPIVVYAENWYHHLDPDITTEQGGLDVMAPILELSGPLDTRFPEADEGPVPPGRRGSKDGAWQNSTRPGYKARAVEAKPVPKTVRLSFRTSAELRVENGKVIGGTVLTPNVAVLGPPDVDIFDAEGKPLSDDVVDAAEMADLIAQIGDQEWPDPRWEA